MPTLIADAIDRAISIEMRYAGDLRELIEEKLGNAVEHVETQTLDVPKAAERKRKRSAGDRPPSGDGRHRPRRRSSM